LLTGLADFRKRQEHEAEAIACLRAARP
jgi:hypothetical protein